MSAVLSAGALAVAGVLWVCVPLALYLVGLDTFGALGQVVLVVLGLTAVETLWSRFRASSRTTGHDTMVVDG